MQKTSLGWEKDYPVDHLGDKRVDRYEDLDLKEELLFRLDSFVAELQREDGELAELLPRQENSQYELDLLKTSLANHSFPEDSVDSTDWKIARLIGVATMVQIRAKSGHGSAAIKQMADAVCDLHERYCEQKYLNNSSA